GIERFRERNSISNQGVSDQRSGLAKQAVFADGFADYTPQIEARSDDDAVLLVGNLVERIDSDDIHHDFAGWNAIGPWVDARDEHRLLAVFGNHFDQIRQSFWCNY